MPNHQLDDQNSIFYLHEPPSRDGAPTFYFVNALTGTTDHWEGAAGPALRAAGFGTLSYNFRGQTGSSFDPAIELTNQVIVEDIVTLNNALSPSKPILVGLSIGGLFAAQARNAGVDAAGLVFLNTLRRIGPRIDWINNALVHYSQLGGPQMFMDATFPMVVNPEFAAAARPNMLKGNYEPLPPEHGHMNLIRNSPQADWDFDWASLDLPVLSITGHHDRVFRDPEVIDELYALLPDARREEWTDCGHMIPLERPERMIESLLKFGAEVEG
ncbi:MAG: alpha/beta hydrolase [Pseudomonadota bacterium]